MEDKTKQQIEVEDIIEIIENNFKEFKGSNEAVLHAAEDIIELFKVKQPEPSTESVPSAQQYYSKRLFETEYELDMVECMESFASLCVEQKKNEYKLRLENLLKAVENSRPSECIDHIKYELKNLNHE